MSRTGTNTFSGFVDNLDIITSTREGLGSVISIEGESLVYTHPRSEDTGTIPILNNDSEFRSIRCSELTKALNNKAFFNQCLIFAEDKDTFKMKLNSEVLKEEIPTIAQRKDGDNTLVADGISFINDITSDQVSLINTNYSSIFGGNDKNGFDLIKYSANNSIDLSGKSFTTYIISAGSDVYTDTVNFNGIIRHCVSKGLSGTANVDIRYSIRDNVYSGNIVFEVFSYDNEMKLCIRNFIQEIDNKVQAEFIEGVLRVYPLNSTINECIINNCILTYAKS